MILLHADDDELSMSVNFEDADEANDEYISKSSVDHYPDGSSNEKPQSFVHQQKMGRGT